MCNCAGTKNSKSENTSDEPSFDSEPLERAKHAAVNQGHSYLQVSQCAN